MKCKHFEWQLNVPTLGRGCELEWANDDEPRWYNEQKCGWNIRIYMCVMCSQSTLLMCAKLMCQEMCRYIFCEQITSWCVGEWDESGEMECEKMLGLSFSENWAENYRTFFTFAQHPLTNCLRIKAPALLLIIPYGWQTIEHRTQKTISRKKARITQHHVLTWKISRFFARKVPSFPRNRVHSRRLRFGLHSCCCPVLAAAQWKF